MVLLQVFLPLRVDRVDLPLAIVLVEERADEELTVALQSFGKSLMVDFEVVVGMVYIGIGIVVTGVLI